MTTVMRTLALAGAIALALAACKKPQMPQMPPAQVGVIEARPQTLPLQRDLVGRLSAYRSADVRARVSGVLLKRTYTEGSEVKENQILFQIDPAPLQAALNSALAQLASAQATYTNAHVTAERARRLIGQKFVSQSDLDDAEASERTAAAGVREARAAVDTARINLGYARVTAPISGRAGKQQVTEGALVGEGSATLLTTVDQIDPLYVNFSMNSQELAQLQTAQSQGSVQLRGDGKSTVDILLGDGSRYAHRGTLDFSSVTVDPSTGSVTLRAVLPNPEHALLPGAFVNFKATLGERHNAYLIPQPGIQRDARGAYVLVVGKDGKVARKDIATDDQEGSNWVVSKGLDPGDKVIVDGVQSAKEGAPAHAVPWRQPAAPGGTGPAAAPSAARQ